MRNYKKIIKVYQGNMHQGFFAYTPDDSYWGYGHGCGYADGNGLHTNYYIPGMGWGGDGDLASSSAGREDYGDGAGHGDGYGVSDGTSETPPDAL